MDNLFFFISKAFWLVASPGSFLVLLSLAGALFLLLNNIRWAKRCIFTLTLLMLAFAVLPLGQWLLIPLEQRFEANPVLPEQVDGIIVLSGPQQPLLSHYWQQPSTGGAAERDQAFMVFARTYPKARLLFTGGGAHLEPDLTQAAVARELFKRHGLDINRITFELQARNTAENAQFSYVLAAPKPAEHWVMITSAFHMPRAVGLFCQLNWQVIPHAVDYRSLPEHYQWFNWHFASNLSALSLALREWIGLTAYYWFGKTNSWFPKDCVST